MYGGDLVSTWVAKHRAHVEDGNLPRKKITKFIVAKSKRNFRPVNDSIYSNVDAVVAVAA